MTPYASNATLAQIAQRMLAAQRILITTHVKADGDALGSCLALGRALKSNEKNADILIMGPLEPNLRSIADDTQFTHIRDTPPGQQHTPGEYDLIIITDTGAWSQLEPIEQYLRRNHDRIIGIDHHTRGDDVASLRYIDPKAVSATAILVQLMDEMKVEISGSKGGVGSIAEALFVGLATDSGWFRYENAGPEAFAIASQLLAAGVNKSRLYQLLEENFGPQRLALEARALSSLQYVPLQHQGSNGATGPLAAIQMLRQDDFQQSGATMEDVTGLVNTPMTVGAVRVSILLTQTAPNLTKISFRSKPAPPQKNAADFVDVNVLAHRFGGGGHVHAAGARVNMDIDQARQAVIDALESTGQQAR